MDQIAPGTLILGVLALFTLLGFLRSFAAFFFNLIALGLGAIAGIWAYNNGYTIATELTQDPQPWMSVAAGGLAFVLTVVIVRKILAFLSGKSAENSQTRSGGFGLLGATFGFILGTAITYLVVTGVRYAGTIAELDRLTRFVSGQVDEGSKSPFFARLKAWIDESQIGQLHQKFDFLNDPAASNAAKLTIVRENDPGKFAEIATSEKTEVIYDALPVDPAIQEAYDRHNYAKLLRMQADDRQLQETFTRDQLRRMNVEKAVGLQP